MAITNKDLEKIRKKLKHLTLEWAPSFYLDTGNPELNEALGSREHGLAYGRMIEISGWSSQGKTALALLLASLAQSQGADVVWMDFERSCDKAWWQARGLDPEKVAIISSEITNFGNEAEARLPFAEELCEQAEELLRYAHKPKSKAILVVDSIPAMQTKLEAEAGVSGQDMRTRFDLPIFLSQLMRRWVAFAGAYNVLIVLINQLRSNPDPYRPDDTTGGKAVGFYSHSRIRLRRAKGGVMKDEGKSVGIQGIIRNVKNKSGGMEGLEIGFKFPRQGPWEFCDAKKLERE